MPRVRDMADVSAPTHHHGLNPTPQPRRASAIPLGALLLLVAPALALAADPTPGPAATPRPPTCAERFPEDGPAGVDLRLGCVVSEVVGLYTAGQAAPPPALSTYAIVLAILVLGAIVLALAVGRMFAGRAGRRLAPVLAGEWWVCATCHSVNGSGVAHCYSCGASPPDGPTLRTADAPATPQSFGRTRKSG
jgi:hypothetical protein